MKKLSRMAAAIFALVMIFGFAGCRLITKTEKGEYNTVVAKVNGKKLIKGEYNKALAVRKVLLGSYYGYDYFDGDKGETYLSYLKSSVLEQFVQDKIIEDKAEELGLLDDEEAITKEATEEMNEYIESLSNQDEFNKAVEKNGITNDDILAYFRSNVIYQKVYDEATKDVTVSDDEAKTYYDGNPYEFTEEENTMNLSYILVSTEDEAKLALDRINGGESFEDVARAVSIDTDTAENGGLAGDVKYTSTLYEDEFMDAAIELKEGEVSEPVETSKGWYIIKCNSKKEYPMKAFDDVKEDIKSNLLDKKKSEAFQNSYSEWEDAAKVKTYSKRV